jgi:N-acetylmuramoyl-L-alanine amidase
LFILNLTFIFVQMFYKIKLSFLLLCNLVGLLAYAQNDSEFKVTLDAGHGGTDPGCRYHGFVEKDITLEVIFKLGKLLENQPNIKVNYTRKTDVLIDLAERGYIANRAHANIFVSVHCNANKKLDVFGSQTFVMGLKKNAKSLEISRRENEVITLEKDYKTKYKGFDPSSPESYIGQTLMQEESLANSISLASKIQSKFANDLGKKDRGVAQDVFMVLHRATMPRVLVEIGFISNKDEGEILNSDEGQDEVAQAIANAIISYKKEYFDGEENSNSSVIEYTPRKEKPKTFTKDSLKNVDAEIINTPKTFTSGTIYKIQLCASNKKVGLESKNFKGLNDISCEKSGSLYKYYAGNETDADEIQSLLKKVKAKGYKSAFIVTFVDGKKAP